jgi:serine protease AprX
MATVTRQVDTRLLVRLAATALAVASIVLFASQHADAQGRARLSRDLVDRIASGDFVDTSVIATGTEEQVNRIAMRHGLRVRQRLATGAVLDVPAGMLAAITADADIDQLSGNYVVRSQMSVTNEAIGADLVHAGNWAPGIGALTGHGVGVAVIDSGIAPLPTLRSRIVASVDFTDARNGRDENGHGTHVAGIIAAAGVNRFDDTRGVAPGAHLISLKVLDGNGAGTAGNVIAAIDWAIAHRQKYNIQIINLSLGGPVFQGWRDDPLCQAVERAYRAGITVVASAGNHGKTEDGRPIYGGITTPGISPFAITVGALNTKGTPWRSDDEVASYSSKGPTMYDHLVKPDVVAPGNKILGLAAPGSTLVQSRPELVMSMQYGQRLQLSGTSMAAAVVSGSAAVVFERHGSLHPFAARALLQYSAEPSTSGLLASGTGAINLLGALAMPSLESAPPIAGESLTSAQLIVATPPQFATTDLQGNALSDNILWGNALSDNILWGNTLTSGE